MLKKKGTRRVAQLVKSLPCKQKELLLIYLEAKS